MRLAMISAVLWPLAAHAQMVDIKLHNQVPPGQKPSLTLTPTPGVARLRVEVVRQEDQKRFVVEHGPLGAGESATLAIGDGRAGRAHWSGTLVASYPDGNRQTYQLSFESAVIGELKVTYAREHLDLDGRVLEFQLSRAAGRAELKVFGDDGQQIGQGEAAYQKEPPGTWLKIGWTQRAGNVLRLELRAVDADGQASLVKLIPWSVRIAHDEVVFATGQSAIQPSEEAKLDASYQKIIDAVAAVRRAEPSLPVRLFIAGHTDTVGASADNRRLSLDRARAIAAWFRARGLPLPTLYAGFGEDALKVKTPDNTDEAANRRADYIVGVEEPLVARGLKASWLGLR
jgi:outer membrane protein OmpA-like peptidoglycan-associated protein